MEIMDAKSAFAKVKRKFPALSAMTLKPQQLAVLDNLLNNQHTLSILPTGYGKTLIFAVFPLIKDEIDGGNHVTLVVSPLRALMRDQASQLTLMGIKCVVIKPMDEMMPDEIEQLKTETTKVVIASPEVLLNRHLPWQQALRDRKKSLALLVFDEAHVIPTWGMDFRSTYSRIGELRSIFLFCTTLLATATLTLTLKSKLLELVHLEEKDVTTIAVSLDRNNISLKYVAKKEIPKNELPQPLKEYLQMLKVHKRETSKAIVYCRNINTTSKLFVRVMKFLGEEGRDEDGERRVGMFHSCLDIDTEAEIADAFKAGRIRCLISTIAYGLGINMKDIRHVFHYGAPATVLEYWQEVGRCARDGLSGEAVLLRVPVMGYRPSSEMKEILAACEERRGCLRKAVLRELWPDIGITQPATQCCSFCSE